MEVSDGIIYDTPGTYYVTVKVVDEFLNETSLTFHVLVEDTTPPTFTLEIGELEAGEPIAMEL